MEPTRRPFPLLSRTGFAVIVFGLLLDLVEHGFSMPGATPAGGAFSVGEHAAHLTVLVGMVLVLAGIVHDGFRGSRHSHPLPERSRSDAVR